MYFLELLVKKFIKKNDPYNSYDPLNNEQDDDYLACEHIFMPLDSTGEYLSCRNCGLVVKKQDLKDINFFRHK